LGGVSLEAGDGLAAKAAADAEVVIEPEVLLDIGSLPAEFLGGMRSAAAVPLAESGKVFAVFQIFSENAITDDDDTRLLLEAAAERLAPLFISSAAFERSIANAFTDPITDLPNERAFFLILENQLAESQRYRDERPVTVLAIDIKGFEEANATFGHAVGDRMLNFVTEGIRGQLRKMDFLSRSISDEFVVILPNAPENTADEIVERIKTYFANHEFEAAGDAGVNVWLNFGSATFWKDGETAQQLLQTAQIRKNQSKSEDSNRIVWFPKEYVN
jgi:diguanylate cyclase (GGDEF)-like protein